MNRHHHAEVVGSTAADLARHLRELADMIDESPDAPGWSVSDVDGSSWAEPRTQKPVDRVKEAATVARVAIVEATRQLAEVDNSNAAGVRYRIDAAAGKLAEAHNAVTQLLRT